MLELRPRRTQPRTQQRSHCTNYTETFLAWAKQDHACVIFNLHVDHSPDGIAAAADAFRRLIDRAVERGGSYYLTYHRFATRTQLEACYPQFRAFLRLKDAWDPDGLFQSDWYRHCRSLFSDVPEGVCMTSAPVVATRPD